jgi:hypothetical protein
MPGHRLRNSASHDLVITQIDLAASARPAKNRKIAMTLPLEDLLLFLAKTLEHYNERATEF